MRYLKQTSISLLILTALSFSASGNQHTHKTEHKLNLAHEQAKWTKARNADELKRMAQRATFLQLENLLKSAVKNNNVSDNIELYLKLIESLKDYPLKMDAMTTYLDTRIKSVSKDTLPEEVKALKHEIEQVIAQNPTHFLRNRWEQGIFTLLMNADYTEGLVHYAQRIKPSSLEMQIAVLNAELQLERTKNETNKKQNSNSDSNIISRYEQLWLTNSKLPNDAQLWAKWYSDGKRTQDKIYQKAEKLFAQNDANGMALLSSELNKIDSAKEDEMVLANLKRFESLLKNPATLPELADRLPLIEENNKIVTKFAVVQTFPRYLRTLSETMKEPNFAPYQQWAKNWQLTDAQIREWEIAFLGRFFDNESPNFQQWRDAEILKLKADNLTERRLRMAIWQKTDLTPWLNALSAEGQQKQEWRYWQAKTIAKHDSKKTKEILTALSDERGFYPMLAAAKLDPKTRGNGYDFGQPELLIAPSISDPYWADEFKKVKPALEEIAELRQLERFGPAKQRWRFLLENLSGNDKKEKQMALSQYANQQNWFDLGVDGSIIAKAFDYIQLRLPIAYSHYYDIALKSRPALSKTKPQAVLNTNVSKSFAMAISRQESAWNPQAQSSANARGLMQLLPSTAKVTADNAKLPYAGEADLFKPLNNILLGTAHLAELNAKYPNNRILIASAYNAGAHRVEKWLARANGKLEMDEFVASIPFYETRGYVQNVLTYDFYYQILQEKEDPQTFSNEEYDRLY
ncbi:transglycosylase SLT domain-containing protein [Aggregatibacter aphrophilus]|uniref:Soluble lytic murein transglycosylase n=2 Tax=Aggregatibacter aphrophilus TaxID=732 RepID=A0A336N2P2_AGGAP|nr:transglycosylase SLT domain-containing protein [Aggregatibacter aphrophilus]KNE85301.1 septation protein A [Aggregatibacter aphrophilus ATCC 33389]OBY54558.1 septation protein A [Aggregatibacter aphrophilus]RDE88843.1 lytic murein transglycosylase [Aggregatibacter aphrophilus]SSY93420.1 Soluble lytic murein transglycosylase precursor [Aggregatibacter aphrophilus]VEF44516.1 Soluble lytic murein transglycosylase precursor [Aggregatibacter aphrophilus ATCC 33389]